MESNIVGQLLSISKIPQEKVTNSFFIDKDEKFLSNNDVIKKIYSYLSKKYRNEYFFQNTLFNKLVLGIHSLNTTTALSQVHVGKSIADCIVINGKAVVYEIKTELDNFERLCGQIQEYYKAFKYVCVLTSEKQYEKAFEMLKGTPVGIYVISRRNTISKKYKKDPEEYTNQLDYTTIFKVLRKKEYENIIKSYFGKLPETPSALYFRECLAMFLQIEKNQLYKLFLEQLKMRYTIDEKKINLLNQTPYEIKSMIYYSRMTEKEIKRLIECLDKLYRG